MQTPSIGRIVIAPAEPIGNNGATEAPAIITRVFGQRHDGGWTVNVRQFLDGHGGEWKTSLALYDDEATARANGTHVAWWPPRV